MSVFFPLCVHAHSSSADGGDSMDDADLENEEDIIEDMEMVDQMQSETSSTFSSQGV